MGTLAAMLGDFAPLLRRVVFIREAPLRLGLDVESIGLRAVRGSNQAVVRVLRFREECRPFCGALMLIPLSSASPQAYRRAYILHIDATCQQCLAGRIVAAGLARRLGTIFLPGVLPAAVAGAILVVMTALNELTLSALLWSSGHETIGVMVFALQYEGNSTAAATVAVPSAAIIFAICAVATALARWLAEHLRPWRQ